MAKHEHQYTMITFAEYARRAEAFGHLLGDRLEWYVSSYSQHRDSGALDQSNFRTAVRLLTEAGIEHETHRFGHWAVGWVEHILIAPAGRVFGESIEPDDYPILDESDYSELQSEQESEAWSAWGASECRRELRRLHVDADRAIDWLTHDDLLALYLGVSDGPERDDDGPHYDWRCLAKVDRDDIATRVLLTRVNARLGKIGRQAFFADHLSREIFACIIPSTCQTWDVDYQSVASGRDPDVLPCRGWDDVRFNVQALELAARAGGSK